MIRKKENIFFIASYGDFNNLPLGGGQTAARRLLATLRRLGYNVIAIHRHPPTSQKRFVRGLQFLFWMFFDITFVFFILLFKSRKGSMTLYMGYMGNTLVPLEWAMSCITRFLGYTNAMYLAGGGTANVYSRSNVVLKMFERGIVNNHKLVMTEGFENMTFVSTISSTKAAYLPNYTEEGFAPQIYPQKPNDRWSFMYFGRICKEKNILLIIDVFNIICNHYCKSYLTIIGGGPDEYCKMVDEKIQKSPYKENITRIGRSNHDTLKQMMVGQHFYLFPSGEPREGHSNALNEAMSYGLVPIVSDNNFLPSIVGNINLVVHEMQAESYVKVILDVIESGQYEKFSREMYERVRHNFTQDIVEKKLKIIIESL